jgi:hypothetical protein
MGQIRTPLPVKLFIGVLTSTPAILPDLEERMTALFGPIDSRSEHFSFDQTHYYDEEMGTPISRIFLGFEKLIAGCEIAGIKIKTNELEAAIAGERPERTRPVNLDPGYLEQSKIILASTKNFFHRVLISEGIYGEVTLHFQDGAWRDFPWTFPDYKSGGYHQYFSSLRNLYRGQLNASGYQIRIPKKKATNFTD